MRKITNDVLEASYFPGVSEEFKLLARTKIFSLRIIRLYCALPKTTEAQVLGKQVLRSGTSVGAHIREGKRSRSKPELISKAGGAMQELEETIYWLDLIAESGIMTAHSLKNLIHEAEELMAILVASVKTLKSISTRNS